MNWNARCWLMAASVLAVSTCPPAAADWLVTREGARIETRGAWKIKNQQVIFTLPNGALSSLRLSDVDLAASEKATAETKAPAVPTPAPAPAEPKPRIELTDDNVRQPKSGAQSPSQGKPSSGSVHEVGLTGAGWSVTLDLPGFEVLSERERADGQGKMMEAKNDSTSMIVSVFVEREPGLGSAEKCRELYWARELQAPITRSEIAFSEYGPLAVVTWMIEEFQGLRVMQKNLRAFGNLKSTCFDVHLSKVNYQPSDQALFDAILRTVRLKAYE